MWYIVDDPLKNIIISADKAEDLSQPRPSSVPQKVLHTNSQKLKWTAIIQGEETHIEILLAFPP